MDFAIPDSYVGRGCWWGPARSRSKEFALWHPWNDLFEGANFWHCYYGDTGALIAHDLTAFKDLVPRLEQFREIKAGIGKLIHEAQRGNSGVAILYSISSVHHWTLTEAWGDVDSGSDRYGKLASQAVIDNTTSWMNLLTDTVGPFRFVSYQEVVDGILGKGGFRMLVLPWAQALSAAEVKAVKGFVREGGTVLADLRPGVSDEHCKPHDVSPFDEVFGVTQQTRVPEIRKSAVTLPGSGAETQIDTKTDLTLKLGAGNAGGRVKEGVPLLVRHDFGKGKAILLNFSVDGYLDHKEGGRKGNVVPGRHAAELSRCLKHVLRGVALDRPVRFAPELPGLRHYAFRSGGAKYIGLLQYLPENWEEYAGRTARPLTSKDLALSLDAPAHVYDAREGRYLGHVAEWTAPVTPGIAKAYSLLPYKVTGIRVKVPGKVRQGSRVGYEVDLKTTAGPGKHVLHVSVLDPAGSTMRHYTKNVNVTGGKASGVVPLALNESPGKYTLSVRDAATGAGKEVRFTVIPQKR